MKILLVDDHELIPGAMMQCKSNKAICRALDLAEPTVKNHCPPCLIEKPGISSGSS
jgi:hypothetical protein